MNESNVEQVNLWSPSRTLLFSTMKDDIGITIEEDTLWSRLDSGKATVFELVEPDAETAGMTGSTSGEIGDEHGHDDAGATIGSSS